MGTNKEIAVIVSDNRNSLTPQFVMGIQNMANRYGYSTMTFSMLQRSNLYTYNEDYIYNLIDYSRYDGIIIVTRSFAHNGLVNQLNATIREKFDGPILSIGESATFKSVKTGNSDTVTETLINHLLDVHSCKDIRFLGGERGMKSSKLDGIAKAYEKHNLTLRENQFLYGGYWTDCAEALAIDIADQKIAKPDAIVCVSDIVANALVQNLYHYGFRVPEDIIVVSCDAGSDSEGHVISLTTIASDSEYVGEAAFIQLYELINGHEAKPGLRERENQLIFGMSCGCGNSRIGNIRMKIEREERKKEADIQYSNSRMEEKLYTIKDFSEFVYFIRNLTYLIVDMEKVSMSLVDEDFQKADCVFLTDYLETGGRVNFDATDIFPPLFQDRERLNTYVLPMVFDEVMYGFVTVSSHKPFVYREVTSDFLQKVTIAICLMKERGILPFEKSTSSFVPRNYRAGSSTTLKKDVEDDRSRNDADNVVFAIKNDIMYKVNVDNALYFESRDKKTYIILVNGTYQVKKRLFEIEESYCSRGFMRISKAVIVNMTKIVKVTMCEDRTILVTLTNKENVRVSRQYVKEFKNNLSL